MREGQIYSVDYLIDNRKRLRKNMTSAEVRLWQALRGEKLQSRKFRRQQSIEHFIVDFYCSSEKLIIELDGLVHQHPEVIQKDQERNARLQQLGFTVLRFPNNIIFSNLESVLETINSYFRK